MLNGAGTFNEVAGCGFPDLIRDEDSKVREKCRLLKEVTLEQRP